MFNLFRFTIIGSNYNNRWTFGLQWPFYLRNWPGFREKQISCNSNLGWKKYRISFFPEGF